MMAKTNYRNYLINTGASILENVHKNETLSEAEFLKRFIHKMNKPGTPCSNADGKPARFILQVLREANMIDRDQDGFYTSTLEAIIRFGGEEEHNFKDCMMEFIEKFLRDHPKPRKSPRKLRPIKEDEIDESLLKGIAGDIVTDSLALTGDDSTARDGIIQYVDEECKKRPRTANDDASNSGETRKNKNICTTRPRVAHTFSTKQTIQHSACNLTTTASGGVRTELTQLQQLTFNFLPSEFSTTTATDATADWSVSGSVLLKATSEHSFEISSNSACTTTTNQDILDTDATTDLSALGSVHLKTTSEHSFEVSINSAFSCDNPSDNPSEV